MITINGIYDGMNIVPSERVPAHVSSKVKITFVESSPEPEMEEIVSSLNFNFWGNEREELDSLDEK
jgi:hypothetical protein